MTQYLAPNAIINSGLTLSVSNVNCPASCGNLSYTGSGWESAQGFGFGTYSFIAKGPNAQGTGLSLVASGNGSTSGKITLEQIGFVLTGSTPRSANVSVWHNGWQSPEVQLQLPFDASQGYHNYSFVFAPGYVTFYVDGLLYPNGTVNATAPAGTNGTAPGNGTNSNGTRTNGTVPIPAGGNNTTNSTDDPIPRGPLAIEALFVAQSIWYGPVNYAGLSFAYVSSVSYVGNSCTLAPTTGPNSGTGLSSTTGGPSALTTAHASPAGSLYANLVSVAFAFGFVGLFMVV